MEKRLKVSINEEDDQFIRWLADRDGVSYAQELRQIFYFELEQLEMLYMEEMKADVTERDINIS